MGRKSVRQAMFKNEKALHAFGSPSRRAVIALAGCLAAAVIWVYWPILNFDFIQLDDARVVTDNGYIAEGLTWANLQWALKTTYFPYWHPMAWVSHILDVELFGVHGPSHHIANLVIHAVNALLVFALLLRLSSSAGLAAFMALAYAVHPMRVEVVAWVAERKELLSTLFLVAATLAYLFYASRPSVLRFSLLLVVFVLGLTAKPMMVTFPCLALVLDLWPLNRWGKLRAWFAKGRGARTQFFLEGVPAKSGFVLLGEKLLLLPFSAAVAFITVFSSGQTSALAPLSEITFGERLNNAAVSYLLYIWRTIYPADLSVYYTYDHFRPIYHGLIAGTLIVGIFAGAICFLRRAPWFLAGLLWYSGLLLPVLGFVQSGGQANANRFANQPILGLLIVAMVALMLVWRRLNLTPRGYLIAGAVACLVSLALAVETRADLRYYRDARTLFTHELSLDPDNWMAHSQLGSYYMERGQLERAKEHFARSLESNPGNHSGMTNYASLNWRLGNQDMGLSVARSVVENWPRFGPGRAVLAHMLMRRGDIKAAVTNAAMALNADPPITQAAAIIEVGGRRLAERGIEFQLNDPNVRRLVDHLASTELFEKLLLEYEKLESKDVAQLEEVEKRLEENPQDPEAQWAVATQLARLERYDQAIDLFEKVIRAAPENSKYRFNFAKTLKFAGELDRALREVDRLLETDPDMARAYNLKGVILGRLGRPQEAIEAFDHALRIDTDLTVARTNRNILKLQLKAVKDQGK